jgi:flavin reductase (DIM6/NTAB) family NADH-FMN oxidoreductase RutF
MTSADHASNQHGDYYGYHDESTREALEIIPTGLFLLTAAHDGQDNWQFVQRGLGITAGPPTIVLVVLSPSNRTTELVEASGEFGLAVCSPRQAELVVKSRGMSGHTVDDKFAAVGLERIPATRIKAPLIAGAFATMECRVQASYPAGDRMMYVGEVLALHHDPTTEPLVHYVRKIYRFLQDPPIG